MKKRGGEGKKEGRRDGSNSFLSDAFIQSQTVRRDTRNEIRYSITVTPKH